MDDPDHAERSPDSYPSANTESNRRLTVDGSLGSSPSNTTSSKLYDSPWTMPATIGETSVVPEIANSGPAVCVQVKLNGAGPPSGSRLEEPSNVVDDVPVPKVWSGPAFATGSRLAVSATETATASVEEPQPPVTVRLKV
jgi:hypothetical protein